MKKYLAILLCLLASPVYAIEKNVSGQYLELQAIDSATGAPKTGDAANLTAYVSGDGDTTPDTLTDTSATELDATKAPGVYRFDLTQGETNFTNIVYSGKSTTSGVYLVPRFVWTAPSGFSTLTIANNATAANVTRYGGTAGTFASGRPEVNMSHIAGSAVSTSAAQIGVNAVNIGGTAQTGFDATGRIQTALPSIAPDAAGGLSTNLQGPRVYYVQSTGSDSNSGLIRTSPLLNPPTSAARNGDVIHFIGSNSFSACSFINRRVKIEGDRASNTTLTITGGAGLIVASGSEICDIKVVNGSSASSSKAIDLASTNYVTIHHATIDAGTGDIAISLDNSFGNRLQHCIVTSAATASNEGYAVTLVENNAGTGGATSLEIDDCYISGGRAAVYIEDRSLVSIKNSWLLASYGVANANSVAAILCDEHYNQGPQIEVSNTRLQATTSGSHTGVVAALTHWTNASGAGAVSQPTASIVGGSISVTGAAGSTVRHLDANLSGSSLHWAKVNHDTTKDNGSYVVKDDGLVDWNNVTNKTTTNAFTNTTISTSQSVAVGSIANNAITAASVATDAATEIGAAAGSAATVSPFLVSKGHTWKFDTPSQVTSPNVLTEITGFDDLLVEMDFSGALSSSASIQTINSVAIADVGGATEPTVVSSAKRADQKGVNITLDGASATAATYTVSVNVTTTDGQTLVRKGRLTVQ